MLEILSPPLMITSLQFDRRYLCYPSLPDTRLRVARVNHPLQMLRHVSLRIVVDILHQDSTTTISPIMIAYRSYFGPGRFGTTSVPRQEVIKLDSLSNLFPCAAHVTEEHMLRSRLTHRNEGGGLGQTGRPGSLSHPNSVFEPLNGGGGRGRPRGYTRTPRGTRCHRLLLSFRDTG